MREFLSSPSFVTWLLGQSVAVVVLTLWIVSLHRMLKRSSARNVVSEARNAQLSDSLTAIVQSHSRELLASRESNLRTVLDAFEKGLENKPSV